MRFTKYPGKSWDEILPGVRDEERDLVRRLVVYESGERLSAEEVMFTLLWWR
jgi:cyclin-dependent kinase